MAHEVHTTDALVLASTDVQDADKLFWLLTKDFGLIFASAKSVREEVSKLRYSLGDLTYTKVSLVRGKGMWRITGADTQTHIYALGPDEQVVFGRIAALVRRVVPTDEVQDTIYDIIFNAFVAFATPTQENEREIIEHLAVARLLYRLGYVLDSSEYGTLLHTTSYEPVTETCTPEQQALLVTAINHGLLESQL